MRVRELYEMWRSLVELGLDEIRLGVGMVRDARRK